jgi:C4-dicarboxylate-specific signal transduction histidine kinase
LPSPFDDALLEDLCRPPLLAQESSLLQRDRRLITATCSRSVSIAVGTLTASIDHEVNQPLAAIAANSSACLRWLTRDEPDLDEARSAAERMIKDAHRGE